MSFEFHAPNYAIFEGSDDDADTFFDLHNHLENLKISNANMEENAQFKQGSEGSDCDTESKADPHNDNNHNIDEERAYCEHDVSDIEINSVQPSAHAASGRRNYKDSRMWKANILQEVPINVPQIDKKRKSLVPMDGHPPRKYISLAESVLLFQKGTPPRFKTNKAVHLQAPTQTRRQVTVPKTPKLLSKNRTRPVNYISREEREAEEVERMKTYKIEVHPLKERILKVPQMGIQVQKKPSTVVEPFNLTEFRKKESVQTTNPYVFTAKPIPSGLFEHPIGLPEKKKLPLTEPCSPAILKHASKLQIRRVDEVQGERTLVTEDVTNSGVKLTPKRKDVLSSTILKPFSFAERDKMILQKKKETQQKVLEEEKNARKFLANPLPQYIRRRANETITSECTVSSSCYGENESSWTFKARPATVVHKPPFELKKPEHSPVKCANVVLNTVGRAQKRQEFDEHNQARLKMYEKACEMMAKKKAEKEAEEMLEMRQKTVHKAQPIKHYKPIPPARRVSPTKMSSPNLVTKSK